jgi:hypothetical protein
MGYMWQHCLFGEFLVSTGKHNFRQTDAARLIRATTAAGLNIKGVTLENGVVRLDVDAVAAIDNGDTAKDNPLDRVLKDAQDKKRPA